jgi:antirestriction protein
MNISAVVATAVEQESPAIYVKFFSPNESLVADGGKWVEVVGKSREEIHQEIMGTFVHHGKVGYHGIQSIEDAEWVIHDHQGFMGIEIVEEEPLDRVLRLAEGIAKYGKSYARLICAIDFLRFWAGRVLRARCW